MADENLPLPLTSLFTFLSASILIATISADNCHKNPETFLAKI